MAHRETFETVNGCKIRIMRGGQGAPLLYLHGALGVCRPGCRSWSGCRGTST